LAEESTASQATFFEEEIEDEETVLELSQRGYVRRISVKSFQRQNRNRNGDGPTTLAEGDDMVLQTQITSTAKEIVVLTRSGKAYSVRVGEIPQASGRSKGTPLVTLLPPAAQSDPTGIVGHFILPDQPEDKNLLILTQQGRVKRLPVEEFVGLTGRGLTALKLKDDDEIVSINLTEPGEQLIVATSGGRVLRVEINDDQLPMQSRTSQGQLVMRLGKREKLVGCVTASLGSVLLMVTEKGYAKRTPVATLRLSNPGELGAQGIQFATKTDALVSLLGLRPDLEAICLSNQNRILRPDLTAVPMGGRDSTGDRIVKLERDEKIVSVTALQQVLPGTSASSVE
jgi:DNA gyrase subunit A